MLAVKSRKNVRKISIHPSGSKAKDGEKKEEEKKEEQKLVITMASYELQMPPRVAHAKRPGPI